MKQAGGWILIVEDEADFLEIIANRLKDANYRTVMATKASEAITKLQNQAFELVLMDIRLATGSGVDVIRHIRADRHGNNYETPVIVMSGSLDMHVIQEIDEQINAVLVKPFDQDALIEKIETVLAAPAHYLKMKGK